MTNYFRQFFTNCWIVFDANVIGFRPTNFFKESIFLSKSILPFVFSPGFLLFRLEFEIIYRRILFFITCVYGSCFKFFPIKFLKFIPHQGLFCFYSEIIERQNQPSEVFYEKVVLKSFVKFTGKPVLETLF